MNVRAIRTSQQNMVLTWDGSSNDRFNISVDDVLMRENTSIKKYSISVGFQHRIKIENITTGSVESLTLENDKKQMYDKIKDGIIDIASMNDDVSREFKEFLVENGTSGDLLRVNVDIDGRAFRTDARLAKNGDNISVSSSDRNIYLPFGFANDSQEVTLTSSDKSVETLTYYKLN